MRMENTLGQPRSRISSILRGHTREKIAICEIVKNTSKILRDYCERMGNQKPYLFKALKLRD